MGMARRRYQGRTYDAIIVIRICCHPRRVRSAFIDPWPDDDCPRIGRTPYQHNVCHRDAEYFGRLLFFTLARSDRLHFRETAF